MMKATEFIRQFNELSINGPRVSEDMPAARDDAINICNIPFNLRDYHVESKYYDESTIAILWVSVDWDNKVSALVNEIVRYFEYLAVQNDLESDIELEITIGNKDASESKYYDRVISRNGG